MIAILKIIGLFKLVPVKTWMFLGILAFAATVGSVVGLKVKAYFAHVQAVEAQNEKLTDQNTRLNTRVNDLSTLNTNNKKAYDEQLRQAQEARRLAEEDRQAAEKRATKYRSIRDAVKNTPTVDRRPVGSAVQSTVDRLWDQQ